MTWLVTGGAGYIGSHVVQALSDAGMTAVVLDDLSTGREEFIPPRTPFVRGTILDGGHPLVRQCLHNMRSDIAGTAGHEPSHGARLAGHREGTAAVWQAGQGAQRT